MTRKIDEAVASHYGKGGLTEAIFTGLEKMGADLDNLSPSDLAPVDEFHTAGRATTLRALEKMHLSPEMVVLDIGSGIGGTARCLADEYGCRVSGVDLTPEYVEVANVLTARMGLVDSCEFHIGSATELPFTDSSFDAGVSFHVAMNIEDRPSLYREAARVLRSGAPLCIFDVMKGPTPGMRYPVPWAETEKTSFLKSREETCALLRYAGFKVEVEENMREFAMEYFREAFAKAAKSDGPPPLGLHILTGANTQEKFSNYAMALEVHEIEPVIIIARLN
jgi:ubiquinone/menaquinone biosynthesis C-methylase UbiE